MGKNLIGTDGSEQYSYYVSVCNSLVAASAGDPAAACLTVDGSASTCQVSQQGPGSALSFVTGEWAQGFQPTWSFIDGAPSMGVQYTLEGQQTCWAHPPVQAYSATVQFWCAESAAPMKVMTTPGSCNQTYIIPTPLSCLKGDFALEQDIELA